MRRIAKDEKLCTTGAKLAGRKNLVILESCKDFSEREFYFRRTMQFGWNKNVLIHQIENRTHEKTLRNQTSFDKLELF
jgi:predicted nuclease of restriction endonuclease-like (RecB) superfamily